MASPDCALGRRKQNDDSLCVICHTRKIKGKGITCITPYCRRKGARARFLGPSLKLQQSEKESFCETIEEKVDKEEPSMCVYCASRPVKSGRIVCFTPSCIAKYQVAKFPPRVVISTVDEDDDSTGNESHDSEQESCSGESASTVSDSATSNEETIESDSNSSLEESMVESDVDEDSNVTYSSHTSNDSNSMLVDSDANGEDSDGEATVRMCENCFRQASFEEDEVIDVRTLPYYFDVQDVEKHAIRFRRAFCNMVARDYQDGDLIPLCSQCIAYLTSKEKKEADTLEAKFPGYFWKLYSKTFKLMRNEKEKLWLIMPKVWRLWWLDGFEADDLNMPSFQTEEIGLRQAKFELGQKQDIKHLVDTFDEYLKPVVLCPWGCTEYYHRCGHIGFDLILEQHFLHIDFPLLSPKKKLAKSKTSRMDFIRESMEDYECLLMNPLWRPLPSIVWLPKVGPVFATCRNHDNGTQKKYFHLPRFPEYGAIPAPRADQLSHAVLKPRTLRHMKRSCFNTSYETVEMRGVYGGIDTCNITEFGNFNFTSHLTSRNESLCIKMMPDICALVNMCWQQRRSCIQRLQTILWRDQNIGFNTVPSQNI